MITASAMSVVPATCDMNGCKFPRAGDVMRDRDTKPLYFWEYVRVEIY